MKKSPLSARSGFTMIELMITVAILGILATIATPSISNSMATREVDQVATKLAADIRYMQQLSANAQNSSVYQIQFNSTTPTSYTLNSAPPINATIDTTRVTITVPQTTLSFDANTLSNNTQAIWITISSRSGNYTKYIFIAPVTGRVRVSSTNTQEPGES